MGTNPKDIRAEWKTYNIGATKFIDYTAPHYNSRFDGYKALKMAQINCLKYGAKGSIY